MTMTSIDIARHAPHAWKERSPTLAMDDSSESSGFLKFARRPFTEMMRIVAQKAIRHALDKDMDKVQRDAVGKAIVRQLKWGLPSLKRERLPLAELLQVKGASGSQLKKFGADIGLMPPEQYQRTTFEQDETSYQKSPQHAALVDLGKRLQAEAVRKGEPLGQADLYVLSKLGERQLVNILDAEYVMRHTQSILTDTNADPYDLIKASILFRGANGQLAAELSQFNTLHQVIAVASNRGESTFQRILAKLHRPSLGVKIPSFSEIAALRQEFITTPPEKRERIFTSLSSGFSVDTPRPIPIQTIVAKAA